VGRKWPVGHKIGLKSLKLSVQAKKILQKFDEKILKVGVGHFYITKMARKIARNLLKMQTKIVLL